MADLTDDEAKEVRSWLNRNQFSRLSSVGGDTTAFGDRRDIWERDGVLFRLTRDRGQWWYDLSRASADVWLDVDDVAGALGSKSHAPVGRVAEVASIDDRVFPALTASVRHAP